MQKFEAEVPSFPFIGQTHELCLHLTLHVNIFRATKGWEELDRYVS